MSSADCTNSGSEGAEISAIAESTEPFIYWPNRKELMEKSNNKMNTTLEIIQQINKAPEHEAKATIFRSIRGDTEEERTEKMIRVVNKADFTKEQLENLLDGKDTPDRVKAAIQSKIKQIEYLRREETRSDLEYPIGNGRNALFA